MMKITNNKSFVEDILLVTRYERGYLVDKNFKV
jgi:hypothetical protein